MANVTEEFRKEVNKLWSSTIDQLEEIKDTVLRTNDRVEAEIQRLRLERDKLLRRLGEQTLKLANQQTVPLPSTVKRTIEQLNEVLETLTSAEKGRKKRKTKKKAAKKKTTKKKTTAKKKATKKKATKKKTTKKAKASA
ncbi:MAG: hypothetical protein AAF658_09895 [Myxococcota bacterium]